MTNTQVVALGVRIFCIWLAVYVLRYAPAMWSLNTSVMPDREAAGAVIVVTAVLVALVIALWFFPLAIARKLLPQATLDHPTSLPIDQLQRAGFCLLGLWLLTESIPGMVYEAVVIYHSTRPNAPVELRPQNFAAMAKIAVEFGLGVWLLFGAKGLLRIVHWARTAGTGEPSNNVVEGDARQEAPRTPHDGR
jgi:hypothetical protein